MASSSSMRQQIPAALANGWPAEFGRHPYPGSGSEAAPRFRHELHLLQRSPSSPSSLAARATPGDLSSHWPWGAQTRSLCKSRDFTNGEFAHATPSPELDASPGLGAAPSVRHRHLSSGAGRAEQSDGQPLSFSASSVWGVSSPLGLQIGVIPRCEQDEEDRDPPGQASLESGVILELR
jgi:hypothetical protein